MQNKWIDQSLLLTILNKSGVTSVSSQVESLSSTVNGIISSLSMLGENAAGLEASLMSAQSQLASITAALEGVVTSEELARVNAVTAKLATILNDVTIENDQATVTISLPNLVFVDGWFDITNNAVDIPLLSSITGSAIFDYKGAINRAALPSISVIEGDVQVNKGISLLDLTDINVEGAISSIGSVQLDLLVANFG